MRRVDVSDAFAAEVDHLGKVELHAQVLAHHDLIGPAKVTGYPGTEDKLSNYVAQAVVVVLLKKMWQHIYRHLLPHLLRLLNLWL